MTAKRTKNKTAPGAARQAQWFMLRGLAREAGHWGEFLQQMRTAFPKHEIHALDLPGTGEFADIRAPLSIAGNAKFVREVFRRRRDVSRPGYLFAVSLGAMAAVEWLHQDPSDVDGMVLVNTSFRGCSPFYRRLWFEAYPHLARAFKESDPRERERHVVAMVSNRPELYDKIAEEWAEVQRRRPMGRDTFVRQLFAAARYRPPLEPPRVPVLLLNSLSDRMVHPSCSESIAELWRCELRRHPTAGHDLVLDAGPWVLDALRAWLAEFERP